MKSKNLSKIFLSGIQAIGFQILGVFFYYYISLYFSKENFGLISWSNAVCMFLTSLLSCGLEQIVGRRVAVSKTSDWAASAYLLHAFIGSLIVFLLLITFHYLFSGTDNLYYLPFFFIAQSIIYIASPLKQYLNSKEKFTPFAVIVTISNLGKISIVYYLIAKRSLAVKDVINIQIFFAIFELISLVIYVLKSPNFEFNFKFKLNAYKKLIKESIPQYLAVIFDSSLARMDWILLGILTTGAITADYSFAYRAYEITKLPILILAPIMLPRFAKMMSLNSKLDNEKIKSLNSIYIFEMFLATMLVLALDILWEPVINYITHGKYGDSNSLTFYILSLCVPMQFFINFLWSLSFAGKKYRLISKLIIFSAVINIVLLVILIPLFQAPGAAISFVITSIIQSVGYYYIVKREFFAISLKNAISFFLIGFIVFLICRFIDLNVFYKLLISIVSYIVACICFRQIRKVHAVTIFELFRK